MRTAFERAVREAFTLPLALLTVAWAGGARLLPGGGVRFEPPPLIALLLALLLLALMARGGAIAPVRLFAPDRRGLENASGAVVLAALLAATAQVFHLLTPARGLANLFVNVLFVALLLNTFARRTDRAHLLGSLGVMFGSALLVKFVVLDAVAAPTGLGGRVFSATIEGLTLGALGLEAHPVAMGYLAFGVTTLYLVVLWWLPHETGYAELGARVEIGPRSPDALPRREVTLLDDGPRRLEE
jgi:hypothetical protein